MRFFGTSRSGKVWGIALAIAGIFGIFLVLRASRRPFPPDTTPDGAYLRIALSMVKQSERDIFPYLETDAQWSAYSIRDMRRETVALVSAHYPPGAGDVLVRANREAADAPDGSDMFVILSKQNGFGARLRRDLSGVAAVEIDGDRASVVTARGTRYPFRRRENGIWGLTIFTAELVAERERAARDLEVVRTAAADYARAAGSSSPSPSPDAGSVNAASSGSAPLSTGSPTLPQPGSVTRPN